jgi:hypothetical protein
MGASPPHGEIVGHIIVAEEDPACCGHKMLSGFRRYAIVAEVDLREAVTKLVRRSGTLRARAAAPHCDNRKFSGV